MRRAMRWVPLGMLVALAACGGSDPVGPEGPRYTVTVTPGTAEVLAGQSRTFTATVTVDPPDTVDSSVTWSLTGPGSLSPAGVYAATAATSKSQTQTATVTARHTASGTTGSATVTVPSADVLAGRGWTAFEAGDYAAADDRFDEALATYLTHVDARIGKGWVALRTGLYDDAEAIFAQAVIGVGDLSDPEVRDALGGTVLAWAGIGNVDQTRQAAETLLLVDPAYAFAHDATYSASDVHWIAARAALDQGDPEGAVPHLDAIAPGHGLDPADPGFVEQALALLSALAATV